MSRFRPGKPWAQFTMSADTVIAAGRQPVVFDQVVGDPPVSGAPPFTQWLVERSGLYVIVFGATRRPTATAGGLSVSLDVDGVQLAAQGPGDSNTGTVNAQVTLVRQLVEGSVVTWYATAHLNLASTIRADRSSLAVTRVGPVRWTG